MDGRLLLSRKGIKFKDYRKDNTKSRVIKIQKVNRSLTKSDINYEYTLSKNIPHLKAKRPVFCLSDEGFVALSVLREVKGKPLSELLIDNKLSSLTKLELTLQLLKAYKRQIQNNKIIHRDIKPSNIIVDMKSTIKVYYIDFNLSIFKNSNRNKGDIAGTFGYIAPEIFVKGYHCTEKSDIFSIARTISEIWGEKIKHIDSVTQAFDEARLAKGNINKLDFSDNTSGIKKLLRKMLDSSPYHRIDIESAIETTNNIIKNHKNYLNSPFKNSYNLCTLFHVKNEPYKIDNQMTNVSLGMNSSYHSL